MKYGHIISALMEQPLLMRPDKVEAIVDLIRLRAMADVRFTTEEIEARLGAAPATRSSRRAGTVAVLPLYGVIAQRMNLIQRASGGTSTQQFAAAFREALADPDVKAILLDVDSPGGSVYGVEELATEIYKARGKKPMAAIANSEAASAAYWIASAVDEFAITPSGMAGSIGVVTIHEDISEMDAKMGIKVTVVATPEQKAEGNPYEPLSEEALGRMQEVASQYYGMFVAAVARNRGVTEATVRNNYGRGRMLTAKEALAAGMVDRIATFEQMLARMGGEAQVMESTTPADPTLVPKSEGETLEPIAATEPPESSEERNARAERLLDIVLMDRR